MNRRIRKKRQKLVGFKGYRGRRTYYREFRKLVKECLMQSTWWKYKDVYIPPTSPNLDRIYWRCYRERKILNDILKEEEYEQ